MSWLRVFLDVIFWKQTLFCQLLDIIYVILGDIICPTSKSQGCGFSRMDRVAMTVEIQVPGVAQADAAGLFPKGVKVLLLLSVAFKS